MRTLQRLAHQRPTAVDPLARLRRERVEESNVKRRARWRAVFKSAALLAVLSLLVLGPMLWVHARRMVCEGLVQGVVKLERAPHDARVAELACQAGQRVTRGEPLLRLEAIGGAEARRPLELEVEQARVKLRMLEQGGSPSDVDPLRRLDQRFDDQTRLDDLRSQKEIVFARALELAREREALEQTLLAAASLRGTEREELEGERRGAELARAERGVQAAQAKREHERSVRLHAEGLLPARDVDLARLADEQSRLAFDAAEALCASLERRLSAWADHERAETELGAARRAAFAEKERGTEVELQALATALERAQRIAGARAELAPEASMRDVAELERRMAQQALEQAQARLQAHDRAQGEGWIHAAADGVIDRLEVHVGAAVEAGAPLLSYVDTSQLWVTAFLDADEAARAEIGMDCRLVFESEGLDFAARCSSMGSAWITCPPELSESRVRTELRLPARIDFKNEGRRSFVPRPGERVQAVFDIDSSPERRARRADSKS